MADHSDARSIPHAAEIDHLVWLAHDLDAAVADLGRRLGVRASAGGRHPGRGTHNALLALGGGRYLEIIAPDPDQPAPDRPRAFGLDRLAAPRLGTWAARGADLEAVVARAAARGIDLGAVREGSRRRADGVLLSWRLTVPESLLLGGIVPFFIDWGATPHPSRSAAAGAELVTLRAEHPEPERAATVLRALGLDLSVGGGPAPALIASLRTPGGVVELR